MLVLSRNRNQAVVIGDDIRVTVVSFRGDKVRLGIRAPLAVPVYRQEVYEAIQRGEPPPDPEGSHPSAARQQMTDQPGNLVLSRKKDETIIIDDHIYVTVIEIRGDKVRLGIVAPKQVSVHRQEVYEAIQEENRAKRRGPDSAGTDQPTLPDQRTPRRRLPAPGDSDSHGHRTPGLPPPPPAPGSRRTSDKDEPPPRPPSGPQQPSRPPSHPQHPRRSKS